MRVARPEKKVLLVQREIAVNAESASPGTLRPLAPILPDGRPRFGVDRSDGVPGLRQVHDAAIDERLRFLRSLLERQRPGHLEPADVRPIDSVERAVTRRSLVA